MADAPGGAAASVGDGIAIEPAVGVRVGTVARQEVEIVLPVRTGIGALLNDVEMRAMARG
jgi:hypothetical protein